MNCARFFLAVSIALISARPVFSQSHRITLAPEQTISIDYPDVTAVFARNSSVARSSLINGAVSLSGVAVGETEVLVFTGNRLVEKISVSCIVVPPVDRGQRQTANRQRATPKNAPPSVASVQPPVEKLGSIPGNSHAEIHELESNTPSDNTSVSHTPLEPTRVSSPTAGEPGRNESAKNATATPLVTLTLRPISIRETNQVLLPVNQVSAAYSLDPLIAEAQVADGQLRIWGRSPGQAVLVLVHRDFSTDSLQVTVTAVPPILPDRTWSDLDSEGGNSRGSYEVRLSSDPMQVSDDLEYRTSRVQFHFTNAIVPSRNLPGVSPVWFPDTYLAIRGDRWRTTLLDEDVENSPISVSSTLLRGVHFSTGDFTIHGGYTSAAGFQTLFLPVQRQFISGATFAHHFSPNTVLGVSGYFIQRDGAAIDPQVAQGVGTLFFRLHTVRGYDLSAEAGISKGIGGALGIAHETGSTQFHADARYRPRQYAASDTDNLNGLQSNLLWNRIWSERLVSAVSGSVNHIFTHPGSQEIEVATENLTYKFLDGISLSAGTSVSRFVQRQALFPDIRRFALPLTVAYDRRNFGFTVQYELSRTSDAFTLGQGYRGSFRWNGHHFHMSANAGLDTQALGIDSVFSAFPELNVELAQLGFNASISSQQLAVLLNDRAFLNSLGLTPNSTLQLVPLNWQAGLNFSWQWARQALEFDSNYNLNSFLTQRNTTFLQTIQYRRGLTNSTEFIAAFTLLDTITPTRRWVPVWQIGARHRFEKSPFPSWHRSSGEISGTVRVQDSSGSHPLRGSEITLDGERRAVSGSDGRYQFSGVREGAHTVEIAFRSPRPFWYSTPSRVDTTADSTVDFGVIYPSAEIIGHVLNDAGYGLAGIGLEARGPQGELNLTTDQAGKFVVPLTSIGDYVVSVNAETVPDGYDLENLKPVTVSVGVGESKRVSFALLAIRALTGSVQTYEPALAKYVPLAGVTVQLAELGLTITTDREGRYLFRNLPSEIFTIRVNGQECGQVQLSAAPQILRHDIQVTSTASATIRDNNSSP